MELINDCFEEIISHKMTSLAGITQYTFPTSKLLIVTGSNLEALNRFSSSTSIIQASVRGNLEVVRLLIMYGANVNARNKFGDTALIYASQYGHPEIGKFLAEHGAIMSY